MDAVNYVVNIAIAYRSDKDEFAESAIQRGYRVPADVELVYAKELIAVTFKNPLPVDVFFGIIRLPAEIFSCAFTAEVFKEAIILYDHSVHGTISGVTAQEQEIGLVSWMVIASVKLL